MIFFLDDFIEKFFGFGISILSKWTSPLSLIILLYEFHFLFYKKKYSKSIKFWPNATIQNRCQVESNYCQLYLLKVNTYKIICLPCFLPRTDYIVGNFSFRLDNLRKWMGKELILIFIRKLRCNMDILSFKTDGCLRKINKNINTLSFVLGIIYRMI